MHFSFQNLSILFTCAFFALGCKAVGVGDPCEPESIPEDGFKLSETYLETSSVQCRTRVCIVNQLEGNPSKILGQTCEDEQDPQCLTQEQIDASIYCTCRCGTPADVSAPTCKCPSGFSCEEVFNQGGPGIRGSYCIKNVEENMSQP